MLNVPSKPTGTHPNLTLEPAQIFWTDTGPETQRYADRYFHPEDGAGESRYVFLEHNRLEQRFRNLSDTQPFVIVETGFGTGLNCLEAIELFCKVAPKQAQLQLISVDLHPLKKTDLIKASQQWPHLKEAYDALIEYYPPLIKGVHSIRWPNRSIQLILHWGSIDQMLKSLVREVDCWFLDGFAPSKNPQMWHEALYQSMAQLAKTDISKQTSFATFTAASAVRRGLQAVGFEVERTKGYGHKRHMLFGQFNKAHDNRSAPPSAFKVATPSLPTNNKIAIIGAGIAGLTSAMLLKEAGYDVQLVDTHSQCCSGASGNPQAALYTRVSIADQPMNRFHNSTLPAAYNQLDTLNKQGLTQGFHPTDLLEIISLKKMKSWENALSSHFLDEDWVQLTAANQLGSIQKLLPTNTPVLRFARSGWITPKVFGQSILKAIKHQPWFNHRLEKLKPADQGWSLTLLGPTGVKEVFFDAVILCSPGSIQHLIPDLPIPLKSLPGQINQIPTHSSTASLSSIITGPCTLLPAHESLHTIGSSYRPGSQNEAVLETDSLENLEKIKALSPSLKEAFKQIDFSNLPARAATRWTTTDYLPIIGPVTTDADQTQHHNLWVNTAHGSRGFTQCWLAAEILLAYVQARQFPICQATRKALHPGRFIQRKQKKRRRRYPKPSLT